jgi:hypothetical protein
MADDAQKRKAVAEKVTFKKLKPKNYPLLRAAADFSQNSTQPVEMREARNQSTQYH